VETQVEEITKVISALQSERASILQVSTGLSEDVRTALQLVPPQVGVTRVSGKDVLLVVEGQAATYARALAYAQSLEATGRHHKVTVSALGQDADELAATAMFVVTIERRLAKDS
jgi:hypothetical protein